MIPICRHVKTNGARCKAITLRDRPYCYFHDRLHRVLTRRNSTSTNSFMLNPLEDRDSVFLALSDVVCAHAAGHIDHQTAASLIQGLQVSGKYAPDSAIEVSNDAVKSVAFTRAGDELAPMLSYCTPEDDCGGCHNRDHCGAQQAQDWRAAHANGDVDDSEEDGNDEENVADGEEDGEDSGEDGEEVSESADQDNDSGDADKETGESAGEDNQNDEEDDQGDQNSSHANAA